MQVRSSCLLGVDAALHSVAWDDRHAQIKQFSKFRQPPHFIFIALVIIITSNFAGNAESSGLLPAVP